MSFNTFGYNGVFELCKPVIDRLLAQVYERNLVKEKGVVRNDEFVQVNLPEKQGVKLTLYLKLGRPSASFDPAATQENRVDLELPVELALFSGTLTAGLWKWKKLSLFALVADLSHLILRLEALAFKKGSRPDGTSVLQPELDTITGQQIKIYHPSPKTELDNKLLDTVLQAVGAPLTAAGLKDEIVKQLKSGALKNADIEIPSAGATMQPLQSWDFRLLSKKRPGASYDSFDLLLYGPGNLGQGVYAQAMHTIPTGASPSYSFALSMRGDVFLQYLNAMLDQKGYYKQGGTLNTPANPYGYMVVSPSSDAKYKLPHPYQGGAGKQVTLSAPKGGQVTLTIPAGGLSANCRATLRNEDTGGTVDFEAGGNGEATISISAAAGARLSVTVRGVSAQSDSDAIIFRPKLSLHDGKLRLDFDYYYIIDNWCDASGDGYAEIAISADPEQAFSFKVQTLASSVSVPWWADVLAFLAGLLVGWITAGPVGGVLGGFIGLILMEAIGPSVLGGIVGEKLDKELQDKLKFPAPGGGKLALFLEQVTLYQNGVVLAGYADAGIIVHYGRTAFDVKPQGVIKLGAGAESFSLHITANSSTGSATAQCYWPLAATTAAGAPKSFLEGRYEDGEALTFSKSPVNLADGKPAVLWAQTDEGLAKLLVIWDAGSNRARVSWVFFRKRVKAGVSIKNKVVATVAGATNMVIAYRLCHTYDGYLELDPVKYFRTTISRDAGLEKWTWNGQEIPVGGTLTAPGFSIGWDAKTDRIIVSANQVGLVPALPTATTPGLPALYVPQEHEIEYQGEDVFGTTGSAKVNSYLEACRFGSLELLYDVRVWPHEILPDPPWMQGALWREEGMPLLGEEEFARWERSNLVAALHERLAEVAPENHHIAVLVDVVAGALQEGEATLDRLTARALLTILAGASR
jgi:hypothetical protein